MPRFKQKWIRLGIVLALLAGLPPANSQHQVFKDSFENIDPVILSLPPLFGEAAVEYTYDINATDSLDDTLSFELTVAPAGMQINGSTGEIVWTPDFFGDYHVEVLVSDSWGATAAQSWIIAVDEGPDTDGDGLSDIREGIWGTDPGDPDSDDDGLDDGDEVYTWGTNPLLTDTDMDGIDEGDEVNVSGTDPAKLDTDGDGFGDGLELEVGTDPLDENDFPNGPVDPAAVANKQDPTLPSAFNDSVAFLWSGNPPIQTGVDPDAIVPNRAAVLRGKVMDADGDPLPGVTITIQGHPELGQTASRVDGMFDMVVNGGAVVTVDFAANGFLNAQRSLKVPWQDFAMVSDVVMLPLDPNVTEFDLDSGVMGVARGSVITDADGTRQATVLCPTGTTAELVFPDGSTQPISTLNVRATEYTVGDMGAMAMPAPLPPNSAYTYAVELSVDEAMAAGATDVMFSQAMPFYLENFLGFPAGTPVPAGYYDKDRAAWVADENGLVIGIISETGGMADVDIDGDDVADTGQALTDLGITDDERTNLANLYDSGQSLWRVPIKHFSPWDLNWGWGPPGDAEDPQQAEPKKRERYEAICKIPGSIIECQDQVMAERLTVAGTGLTLNYRSDRVLGRVDNRQIEISLSGASLPASLKRIDLEVAVAGQEHSMSFPADPNQATTFTWNGLDAFGRPANAGATMSLKIAYPYDGQYQVPQRFGYFGNGIAIEGNRTRQEVSLVQFLKVDLPFAINPSAHGLGAWSLDVHHVYSEETQTLYQGDGSQRNAAITGMRIDTVVGGPDADVIKVTPEGLPAEQFLSINWQVAVDHSGVLHMPGRNQVVKLVDGMIYPVAGNGESPTLNSTEPDGIPATEARISPSSMTFGPDGSLYLQTYCKIRRIHPDGIITTVAGEACLQFGDSVMNYVGGPALEARLSQVHSLAVADDGTVYYADVRRIFAITPEGMFVHVAGNGMDKASGDGGPAKLAGGQLSVVRIGPDGDLYVLDDSAGSRVRKINADGTITTVVGPPAPQTVSCNTAPDGSPATGNVICNPKGMELLANGNIVVSDSNANRIRVVNGESVIHSLAGGSSAGFSGDGGQALRARLKVPTRLAVGPGGTIYFVDAGNKRIRRLSKVLGSLSVGDEQAIASEDGTELFIFNTHGRHLRTVSALTGSTLLSFGYSVDGLVISVTDADGKVTTIERNVLGQPTAIVAPFGQRTGLAVDANGYLSSITNPMGETLQLVSTSGGLITRITDPRGKVSEYQYDSLGRLVGVSDNNGYSQTLVRSEIAEGFEVARTTALGRANNFKIGFDATTAQNNANTLMDGSVLTDQFRTDSGKSSRTSENGTVTTVQLGADPRFGMQSPVTESLNIELPSSLALSASSTRVATFNDVTDTLDLETLTETVTIAGETATIVFDTATRTEVITSPEGRAITLAYDAADRVVGLQHGDRAPIAITYNALGQPESLESGTGPDSRIASFTHGADGYMSGITGPMGRTTSIEWDAAGRMSRKTLAGGAEMEFTYDQAGDLDNITPPNRPAYSFDLNLNGDIESITPPAVTGSGTTTFTYNDDRLLTSMMAPGQEEVALTYDNEGRVDTITLSEGGVLADVYTLAYLPGNRLESVVGPGTQKVSNEYDGDFIVSQVWSDGVSGSTNFEYDSAFRVKSEFVNGGNIVAYSYDADDLQTGIGDFSIVRDSVNGLATSATLDQVGETWSYNQFAEITDYVVAANGSDVYHATVTRDKLGRITQKIEIVEGVTGTWDYQYDAAGQLTEVRRDTVVVEGYSYDASGNRTSATVSSVNATGTYDDQDRLLTYGDNQFTYTPAGRLLTLTKPGNQATDFDYDIVGNLRSVTLPGGTQITYAVDGQDRRIERAVNGTVTGRYLYGGLLPRAELDELNNLVSRFVFNETGMPVYMVKGDNTYRLVSDLHGNVRLVVNATTGIVAQRLDYDSFGNVTLDTNPGFQPFGFGGGLYDHQTGLVRFGYRDYDARTGRWTAQDPIGFGGGDGNLYRYVHNDPVNRVDVAGLYSFDAFLGNLNGFNQAAMETINPMLLLTNTMELLVDAAFGDWMQETGQYRNPYPGIMYPPPPGADPTEYFTAYGDGACAFAVGSIVIGGVTGAVRGGISLTKSGYNALRAVKLPKVMPSLSKVWDQLGKGARNVRGQLKKIWENNVQVGKLPEPGVRNSKPATTPISDHIPRSH